MATPDANTVITALSQLDEVLQSEERCCQLAPHVDQLLILATLQYRLVLNTKMSTPTVNKEECIKIYRSLTNCVMMVSEFNGFSNACFCYLFIYGTLAVFKQGKGILIPLAPTLLVAFYNTQRIRWCYSQTLFLYLHTNVY